MRNRNSGIQTPRNGYMTMADYTAKGWKLMDDRRRCQDCGEKHGECERVNPQGNVYGCYVPCRCERKLWKVYEFTEDEKGNVIGDGHSKKKKGRSDDDWAAVGRGDTGDTKGGGFPF